MKLPPLLITSDLKPRPLSCRSNPKPIEMRQSSKIKEPVEFSSKISSIPPRPLQQFKIFWNSKRRVSLCSNIINSRKLRRCISILRISSWSETSRQWCLWPSDRNPTIHENNYGVESEIRNGLEAVNVILISYYNNIQKYFFESLGKNLLTIVITI